MLARLIIRVRARWSLRALFDQWWISEAIAVAMLATSMLPQPVCKRLELLATGARRTETGLSRTIARTLLRPWLANPIRRNAWREHRVGWGRYHGGVADIGRDRGLTTSLLLKEPGPNGEKGVLHCAFEPNWMRIIANHDARRLLDEYLLVVASSWSPTDHAVIANLQGLSDDPVFVGISNRRDVAQYRIWEAGGGIFPLPIQAGDWMDPGRFRPGSRNARGTDIVMVSHFARWKRHWLLFEALRKLPGDLNVVLVGRRADGRGEREMLDEAYAFGVRQQITVRMNIEADEVAEQLCDARVAVALAKREGSCVAVTEAMFADTPVVMMDDAHIGTRAYINPATGRLARRRTLARHIAELLESGDACTPRRWADKHISAHITSTKLNAMLREHSERSGRPWTRDIVPMCRRYVPQYLEQADERRMAPAVARLRRDHGIELVRFAGERATSGRAAA